MKRREDLSAPRRVGRRVGIHYDPDAFGQFSEAIARFIGTARFLVWQTMFIILWLLVNRFVRHFDGKQLGLLTLLLSLQAAYAAPLILLAQNRQEARDRSTTERDRAITERTQADTEFLARELASVRLVLSDQVTGSDLAELTKAINKLTERVEFLDSSRDASD
jgi:uncharacterized membrane protein